MTPFNINPSYVKENDVLLVWFQINFHYDETKVLELFSRINNYYKGNTMIFINFFKVDIKNQIIHTNVIFPNIGKTIVEVKYDMKTGEEIYSRSI